MVNDQIGSPTYAADLAQVVILVLKKIGKQEGQPLHKLFHYSNQGACSWFDLASHVIRYTGIECIVEPVGTKDYPTEARRPGYSVLDTSKIRSWLGIEIPHWTDSLKRCCDELMKG